MCYSITSSLRTSGISLLAIIYLLSSGIPKFKWLAIVLIGWCSMQFVEGLIWMTNPRSGCNGMNKFLTVFVIPIVLLMQPLGTLWGSLFVIPWDKSTDERKKFLIYYTVFLLVIIIFSRFIYPLFKKRKTCTVVTERGHLNWYPTYDKLKRYDVKEMIYNIIWGLIIIYPLIKYWAGKIWPFYLIPLFGIFIGFFTDSPGSIWCYITSYGSIIGAILLFLYKRGIKLI